MSERSQDQALQIAGLRHSQQRRVVAGGAALFDELYRPARVGGGGEDGFLEHRLAHVEAAARRYEDAARREKLERAQVDLLVAAERRVHGTAGLGEGGRVEDDGIELLAFFHAVRQ